MQTSHASEAFSSQAKSFDSIDAENPLLIYLRRQVRKHVSSFLSKDKQTFILELNAGTGLDAVYFAENNYVKIHATDISEGMITELKSKIENRKLQDKITCQQLSYHHITDVPYRNFDYVFSDFGGLNCTADLASVLKKIPQLLNTGAKVTLVIMPEICPWEWLWIFRGQFKKAFRRFNNKGTNAQVEGVSFTTWYYSLKDVKAFLGDDFNLISAEAMSLAYPPPQSTAFAKKFPGLIKVLQVIDESIRKLPVLRGCGDHFIATFEFIPKAK